MKKLLMLLASIGLTTTAGISVVACANKQGAEVTKIDLNSSELGLNTTISGFENMTDIAAFEAFIQANVSVTDLRDSIVYSDFQKPEYKINGSLTISAKPDTKYSGSISVTINADAIEQKDLNDLHLTTSLSTPKTSQKAAFELFINENIEVGDLRDNVTIADFTQPTYKETGSLKIQAKPNRKYTGNWLISIPALNTTDIGQLITNRTIQGIANMTADDAFQDFLAANSSWSNLSDYVEYNANSFVNSDFKNTGSLTITGKADTGFAGTITITINAFEKKLSNLDATVAADLNATPQEVFQAFLDKNQAVLGHDLTLDQVDLTAFEPSQFLANGQLTVAVKNDSTSVWSGLVKLKIKYILKEANIQEVFEYFSDNNLFKFDVVAGEVNVLTDLVYVADRKLSTDMKQFYEYDDDISAIWLDRFAWNVPQGDSLPSIEELNTPGTILNLPNFACTVWFNHPDREKTWKYFSKINITWTVVTQS